MPETATSMTTAEKRSALSAASSLPRSVRAEADRLARRGEVHPDPAAAHVMRDWALATSSNPVIRWGGLVNLAVAGWAVYRFVTTAAPAPARWFYAAAVVLALLAAWILAARWWRASRLLALPELTALPAVAAPVRGAPRRAPVDAPGAVERGRFLSDQERAHLATVTPQELTPGWYGDPLASTGSRFWNGTQWTGRVIATDSSA